MGHRLDTTSPESRVEGRVNSDIGGSHSFLCKVDNGLDGPWCPLLERATVNELVEVDRVLPGHDILKCRTSLASGLFVSRKIVRLEQVKVEGKRDGATFVLGAGA